MTIDLSQLKELLGAWRPEPMTPETAPEWLSELSQEEYAKRRNDEQKSAIHSLDRQKDWLKVAASMLHTAGTMSPSEYGSYGHSCIIVADALVATRDSIVANLLPLIERHEEQARRIERLEAGLRPFARAVDNIPDDQEDFKIVAHVPGGRHVEAFRRMSNDLTAGNFRAARSALNDSPEVK